MPSRNPSLFNDNALKLGLFGSNCSGGLAFTRLPDRWDASWDHNVKLAQLADQVGIECMVPIARWKGYGGETNVNGTSWETITWATGLLAATRNITVFGTVHAPMIHPVVAAKQMITSDHVSHGRFGLNIVCGWNQDEFEMFGVEQREHDRRYEYGQEWWNVVKLLWSGQGPRDYEGKFFKLKGLEASPRPYGEQNPVMMNAGASPLGRGFAIRNCDLHFDNCEVPEDCVDRVKETKALAHSHGHEIQVWTSATVVCRTTQREVDDFLHRVVEAADWGALDHLLKLYVTNLNNQSISPEQIGQFRQYEKERAILGYGASYPIFGTPDQVVRELNRIRTAGFDGLAIGFHNPLDELPYFAQEVLPRMEGLGLR
jgi:dimethylsulfone monooxygenase